MVTITNLRIRIVKLDNYKPSSTPEGKKTPDNAPYAKSLDSLKELTAEDINGFFNGKSSGIMIFNKQIHFLNQNIKIIRMMEKHFTMDLRNMKTLARL